MADMVLLYTASAILIAWGVAHIIPTRTVVAAFGPLSSDNRINITMEWVAEGLALMFLGLLAAIMTLLEGGQDPAARAVFLAIAGFCLIMGAWTFAVGRRSTVLPIRLCPLVMAIAAALLVLGSSL